jgi:ankyrin repeat protein
MASQQRYFSPTLHYISNICANHELHQAVKNVDIATIQALLDKKLSINQYDQNGNTPLFYAIESKNANIVNLLAQNGADVNKANKHGHTPLFVRL